MASTNSRVPFWAGLACAREIAAAAGLRSVGTQHVLLAVLRRAEGDVTAVLRAGGVDESAVVAALRGITGTGCRVDPVPADRVSVSPRVLALVREAASDGSTVTDLQILGALLTGDEPSMARLVLTSLGAHHRMRRAVAALTTRADDSDGNLVEA